jgi:hypothetical protein
MASPAQTLSQVMLGAFPPEYGDAAQAAVGMLEPFVDTTYRQPVMPLMILSRDVGVPSRIYFTQEIQPRPKSDALERLAFHCLRTRSTDGYVRQLALKSLLQTNEPLAAPFVVLLVGEYVVEIIHDIVAHVSALDRVAYSQFVRENRQLMQKLRARATSYWDCYYRRAYPDRGTYPGLTFLDEIERWAA